ncbi:MAG TPA: NAD(+) diphosphatase [Gammaproteobacteria bacterium]|nr:NAD(+) diphosphatase [Gammaproteobacteria bacterium]
MLENFIPDSFIPSHSICLAPNNNDLIFYYKDSQIYLFEEKHLPLWQHMRPFASPNTQLYCFGEINKQRCLLTSSLELLPSHFNLQPIRFSYEVLGDTLYRLAGLGCQLNHWRTAHHYCGRCAAKTFDKPDERALICPQCNFISYPQLYPCIIVLVTKGSKLLLARSPHFQPGIYSTLAGFIEPGESVENAAFREIKEEVNISIQNLQYVTSQPWPFPNSLMLGFHAEYESGEIIINPKEIEDAQWFSADQLPPLSSTLSISHFLIKKYLQSYKNML